MAEVEESIPQASFIVRRRRALQLSRWPCGCRSRAQEDIDAYMAKEGSAEAALEKLQRFYRCLRPHACSGRSNEHAPPRSACKLIEQRMTQKKAKFKVKIPEIEATHSSLVQMQMQSVRPLCCPLLRIRGTWHTPQIQELNEPLVTHYELAQSVFARARVNVHEEDKVCLWLGVRSHARQRWRHLTRACWSAG